VVLENRRKTEIFQQKEVIGGKKRELMTLSVLGENIINPKTPAKRDQSDKTYCMA
jgi:hypothetical protein